MFKTSPLITLLFLLLVHLSAYGWDFDPNALNPKLATEVLHLQNQISSNSVRNRVRGSSALSAYRTQVLTQLRHVSFQFQFRDDSYVHSLVLKGKYPDRPTRIAIEKARLFLDDLGEYHTVHPIESVPVQKDVLANLLIQQKAVIDRITRNPIAAYEQMRTRLIAAGPEASFPEFQSTVEYLIHQLLGHPVAIEQSRQHASLARMRSRALTGLRRVLSGGAVALPYLSTVEEIQKAVEFFDVAQRGHDPSRSPKLYHSDRYEYYLHFLKGEIPDHILFPTVYSLGATDILKARGVPIGFAGVNTDISWVDGFYQTPFEFFIHDINHCRRMYQFLKEAAQSVGMTILEFARQSNQFVRQTLLPLIIPRRGDSPEMRHMKRVVKVLIFEINHEDALAATREIIRDGILRPPQLITPFERIDGDTVSYIMEPGATTLAYAYRKLAHDFYDMPGDRQDNIVSPEYRTRPRIVEAAQIVLKALGYSSDAELLNFLVSTDQGFPNDFRRTLERDIESRPGETVGLDQEHKMTQEEATEMVARLFHENWQTRSGYVNRWKLSQAVFRDGRGINDDFEITTKAQLLHYFEERQIPERYRSFFSFQWNPRTGRIQLFEDIQHLPHAYLAPNNQYENIEGSRQAVQWVNRITDERVHFQTVDEGVDWVQDGCERMNKEWLRRNAKWALADPLYNRSWRNLRAIRRQNGIELLKLALDAKFQINPNSISSPQRALLQEAIRRVEAEVQNQARREVREALTADMIHANWQRLSGYSERWKPSTALLSDGSPISSDRALQRYLRERSVPRSFHRYFKLMEEQGSAGTRLYEDIQHLPNSYLSASLQLNNEMSAQMAIQLVDRIWDQPLTVSRSEQAERWIMSAAQMIHQGVIDRNLNGARDNPQYNVHWRLLPPRNQRLDVDMVRLAFEARLSHQPGTLNETQRRIWQGAFSQIDQQISNACIPLLRNPRAGREAI